MTQHILPPSPTTVHWGFFDAKLDPVLEVASGDTVVTGTVSGAPEYMPGPPYEIPPSLMRIHEELEPELGPHIVTGPIAVRGARPGDTLEVEIIDITLDTDWGWSVHRPGFGTLPVEDFPDPWIRHLPIDRAAGTARMPWGTELPLAPFFGILAVAPAPAVGRVSSKPPDLHGGNMDNKELVAGTRLFVPVWVEGALFQVGDGHAAQGDGEVNQTGLETSLSGRLQFFVHSDRSLDWPRAETPTHHILMGFDPDLERATEIAIRETVEFLTERTGLTRGEAYSVVSMAADLRITELVDGNVGVHVMVAKELLGDGGG